MKVRTISPFCFRRIIAQKRNAAPPRRKGSNLWKFNMPFAMVLRLSNIRTAALRAQETQRKNARTKKEKQPQGICGSWYALHSLRQTIFGATIRAVAQLLTTRLRIVNVCVVAIVDMRRRRRMFAWVLCEIYDSAEGYFRREDLLRARCCDAVRCNYQKGNLLCCVK